MIMKSKPIVMDKLSLENDFFIVDFDLTNNIVLLTGEDGMRKSRMEITYTFWVTLQCVVEMIS